MLVLLCRLGWRRDFLENVLDIQTQRIERLENLRMALVENSERFAGGKFGHSFVSRSLSVVLE